MTEHDVQQKTVFPDEVAFGGWFLDLHTPGGLLAPTSEPASAEGYKSTSDYAQKSYVGPYGIPLRVLIAKDLNNLLMAGRNVSMTHAALGTARVMATTALMGQAVGTACAHSLHVTRPPCEFGSEDFAAVQQQLLRDGCFLPNVRNTSAADFARSARATASSSANVSGIAPNASSRNDGLTVWADQVVPTGQDELHARRGQWIAVATEQLDAIEVCLTNLSDHPQIVQAWLGKTAHIWDYRTEFDHCLADTKLVVPPGGPHWVRWPLSVRTPRGGYVRLDLGVNSQVCWLTAGAILPGHMAAFDMGKGRMRRYGPGVTLSFRVSPAQSSFGPENVLSGVTRPYQSTNLWRSDPARPLPQWLQLEWDVPRQLKAVQLTFPGHLVREYHAYGPFYRDPQSPRDYTVETWNSGSWIRLTEVTGNYQRLRRHEFEPVETTRLRVVVTATNGDPSAAIYEVRCE
jgi:hypothetical protein